MNTNLENRMSQDIMLRIRTIYRIKKIALSQYTNTFLLFTVLVYTCFMVSVLDVFLNAFSNHSIIGGISYFFNSFIHTQLMVQILSGLMLIAGCRLMMEFSRKFINSNIVSRVILRRAV